MSLTTRGFGSDNHATVHPEILQAIINANLGHAASYGTDPISERVQKLFKEHFGPQSESYIVFNGTAANVTALKAITKPWQSVLCTDISHINVDECASPELIAGVKLIPVPSVNGKFTIENLQKTIVRKGDQHYAQTKAISITQPTEIGTVYTIQELTEIVNWAKKNNLLVHLDGARFTNACYALRCTFKQLTTDIGIDVLSFGGTKNGFMLGECVVFMNQSFCQDFKYIRKQAAQLPSKTRYIAAQFEAFLSNNLWAEIAKKSIDKANELYISCNQISGVEIKNAPQSNAVFAKIPQAWVKPLKEISFFYVWDENTFECRWMTSWDTQSEEISLFTNKLKELSKGNI